MLLTAEQFDRLAGSVALRAHRVEDLTGADRDEILAGLDAVATDAGNDD